MLPRVVFMGTPEFAVPSVEALATHAACTLAGVVCQPDKVHGRHTTPQPPPVKLAAQRLGVPVLQPTKLRSGPFPEQLAALAPDLIVVAAYGRILPPAILALPPRGCVNVHASLLPLARRAPIQWAIASGDRETGVCLMEMEEGLDTGGVYACARIGIGPEDTGATLHDRLSRMGAELLAEHLPALLAGTLAATPQDPSAVTLARMLTREDGRVDWSRPAEELAARIRGFHPWPGAWTTREGAVIKLFPFARVGPPAPGAAPGEVVGAGADGLTVACGDGTLTVPEVQLEGRRRLPVADVLRGHALPPGTRLT